MTDKEVQSANDGKAQYALGPDLMSSVRMYFQHWMWRREIGYSIHPSIPVSDTARIADVCCGTGMWLIDLAKDLPNAKLEGFDITSKQYPAKGFLPKNVGLHVWDVFSPVPQDWRHSFDIVHVGLATHIVRNDNALELIEQLLLLLKPGGYIQWDEADFSNLQTGSASPEVPHQAMDNLRDKVYELMARANGNTFKWAPELGNTFRKGGLEVIDHRVQSVPDDIALPWTLQHLCGTLEIIASLENSQVPTDDWWEVYDAAADASAQGASLRTSIISIVGRYTP